MDDPLLILDQVVGCLDKWALSVADISLASQSENIVYRLTTTQGAKYALRVHRPGYHTFAELVSEHEWTNALIDTGFPLPNAIPTIDGELYVPVNVDGGVRFVGLVEWLDGNSLQALTEENENLELLYASLEQAGELMAKLHNHSRQWQPSESFSRHKFDIDGFFGGAPFWGRYWDSSFVDKAQQQLLLKSQKQLIQTLGRLGNTPEVFGMIHADLHHGNLFLSTDKQSKNKMYLIDFDDAGFGWYLYDIAVALHEYQGREDFSKLSAALLQGYEKVTILSSDHRALIPMFLHIRSLALIGWITARPELGYAELLKALVDQSCEQATHFLP